MKGSLVVTSISGPNDVLRSLAVGCTKHGVSFHLIGDTKTPADFALDGCNFHDVNAQLAMDFQLARVVPVRSYARKNIGYLLAIQEGADWICETDDDNYPREGFWLAREREMAGTVVNASGWVNVYGYFCDTFIYPRGFPLEFLQAQPNLADQEKPFSGSVPIQQGLADENPDVDAIFRLVHKLPVSFRQRSPLVLGEGAWCPFNSQNTTFFREVFPLLYLPSFCSFRMTDIWRSFVAQRILWTCNWNLAFHSSTVWQERNEHNLLKDFEDEIPGYLNNARICLALGGLDLPKGVSHMKNNLITCYECLIGLGVVGKEEMPLLLAWIKDLNRMEIPA